MNRRTFLSQAAAAGLAAGASGSRVRIAFFGGTHSHAEAKAKIVKNSPDYELAGIWEEDAKVLADYTALGIPSISRDQALADRSITAIAVESAVKDHYAHARMALEAGKHVHVEKPPAATLAEMRELVGIARRKNLLLQSGYMWRYHPAINKALEAARSGWLGEVYLVRGSINTLIAPNRRPEWALFKGGQMFELGAHLIDAIVRLLGRPEKVTSILRKDSGHDDTLADNTVAVLEYPRTMVVLHSATLQPNASAHRTFEILGTNGTAIVRPIEPPAFHVDLAKAAGPYKAGAQKVEVGPYTRYVDDLIEFAAAVRGEKRLSVGLDEELLVQETLLRASRMTAGS